MILNTISLRGYSLVSCGILRRELNYLNKIGLLKVDKIFYTMPGLHENPRELEKQLRRQLNEAGKHSSKVIVVYGSRCYVDMKDPSRDIDVLIRETGANAKRVDAKNCMDMLASTEERKEISEGRKIYWLSAGWLEYWKVIFKDWDQGKANETFPQHDKAIVLDLAGIFEEYATHFPERILEFADWMKLSIEPRSISLDRFQRVLLERIF